jgi:tetratricopeptide (TPR) repeat protein
VYKKNYELAIEKIKSALDLNPNLILAHLWLGRAYQAKKMYSEAIDQYKQTLAINPEWPVAYAQIGNVYGVSGQKVQAEKVLDKMQSLSLTRYVTPYGIALLYAGLNDHDKAFEWLEKALQDRAHWLVWLNLDPRWDAIRSDKRFAVLVVKVGLSKQ